MQKYLLLHVLTLVLILAPHTLKANMHPDEKTFTEDRIDCPSKELDMRQVYAHKDAGRVPEGISLFERPSLKLQLIWHTFFPNKIYDPTKEKFFVVRQGITARVNRDKFIVEFTKYWERAPLFDRFVAVWRECVKQQGKERH